MGQQGRQSERTRNIPHTLGPSCASLPVMGARESAAFAFTLPSPPHLTSLQGSCFWNQECRSAPQPDHWESYERCSGMPDAQVNGLGVEGRQRILANKSLSTCSCTLPYNYHQGEKFRAQTTGTNNQINKKVYLIISPQNVPFLR